MIRKIAYTLIPVCMTASVAMAGPQSSNAMLLSSGQMDQVTAGLSASADAGAVAVSSVLALTKVDTVAVAAPSQGNQGAGGVAAGGVAAAGAAGQGGLADSGVAVSTSHSGPNTQSILLSFSHSGQLASVSGGAVVSVDTVYNPL